MGPVRGDPARGPGPARRGKLGRRDQRRPRRAAVLLCPRRARGHHQHRLGRRPRADAARGDLQRPRRGSPASPRRSASSSRPARPSRSAASTRRSPTRRRTCTRRTIPAGRCAPSRRSSTRSRWPRRSSGWRCGRGAPCTSAARTPWRCPAPWRRRPSAGSRAGSPPASSCARAARRRPSTARCSRLPMTGWRCGAAGATRRPSRARLALAVAAGAGLLAATLAVAGSRRA